MVQLFGTGREGVRVVLGHYGKDRPGGQLDETPELLVNMIAGEEELPRGDTVQLGIFPRMGTDPPERRLFL